MNYQNLKEAILAVEENNKLNDAKWSDWPFATDIGEVYGIELDKEDIAILERAIESEGASIQADMEAAEREEYGQNFAPAWYAKNHGGARPGAGRKSSDNPTKSGSIRLTPERWDKLRSLGMEWLSDQIDAATLPESSHK
ncbi:hypothetical protein ACUXVY_12835 [Chromobacterium haemolyticum]|uniref:hypothetical protein n=1 Tax=Chromobacterium haemolyticum TaxID=394935 RepID=UPI0040574017